MNGTALSILLILANTVARADDSGLVQAARENQRLAKIALLKE